MSPVLKANDNTSFNNEMFEININMKLKYSSTTGIHYEISKLILVKACKVY